MVLRGFTVADVCWRCRDAGDHIGRSYVPSLAAHHASRRVVPQYGRPRTHRTVLRHRHHTVNLLYHHHHRRQSWNLDIPEVVCGRWLREYQDSRLYLFPVAHSTQVESFIPLWEWDEPKKKKGKKKDGKSVKGEKKAVVEGANSTGVDARALTPDSAASSRPQSRQARVEEVPEDS